MEKNSIPTWESHNTTINETFERDFRKYNSWPIEHKNELEGFGVAPNKIEEQFKKDIEFKNRTFAGYDKLKLELPKKYDELKNLLNKYKGSYFDFAKKQIENYKNKLQKNTSDELYKILNEKSINYDDFIRKDMFEINGSESNIEFKDSNYCDCSFYDHLSYTKILQIFLIIKILKILPKKPSTEFFLKYDFGIRLDIALDLIEKLENYRKEILQNQGTILIKIDNLFKSYFYFKYLDIPKFYIEKNILNGDYKDFSCFKEEILKNNSKSIELIKLLFINYHKNKEFIDELLKKYSEYNKSSIEFLFLLFFLSFDFSKLILGGNAVNYFNYNFNEYYYFKEDNIYAPKELFKHMSLLYDFSYKCYYTFPEDKKGYSYNSYIEWEQRLLKDLPHEYFKIKINNDIDNIDTNIDDVIKVLYEDYKNHKKMIEKDKLIQDLINKEESNNEQCKQYNSLIKNTKERINDLQDLSYQEIAQKIKDKNYFFLFKPENIENSNSNLYHDNLKMTIKFLYPFPANIFAELNCISFEENSFFRDYLEYYHDEDANDYIIYWGGKLNSLSDLSLESIDNNCANEIRNKINLLFKAFKTKYPSG